MVPVFKRHVAAFNNGANVVVGVDLDSVDGRGNAMNARTCVVGDVDVSAGLDEPLALLGVAADGRDVQQRLAFLVLLVDLALERRLLAHRLR